MAALTKGKPIQEFFQTNGAYLAYPMLDNVILYQGAIAVLDSSGWIKPAVAATGLVAAGVAVAYPFDLDRFDNTVSGHANGFVTAYVKEGIFSFVNDGTNPVLSTTQPGTKLYAVDDQTLSVLSTGRSPVARLVRLDPNTGLVMAYVSLANSAVAVGI